MRETAHHIIICFGIVAGLALTGCGGPGPFVAGPSINDLTRARGDVKPNRAVRDNELRGEATWYGDRHHGRLTANGEHFDMHAMTAAHRTLPFNTVVRVTERETRKSVVVRINDRGPRRKSRVIDLSRAAANDLGIIKRGKADVTLTILVWGDHARYHHKHATR